MYFMFRNLKAHLVAQEYPTEHTISRIFPDSRHRQRQRHRHRHPSPSRALLRALALHTRQAAAVALMSRSYCSADSTRFSIRLTHAANALTSSALAS